MKPGKSKHRKKDKKRRKEKEKEETSKSSISPVFAKKNPGSKSTTFSNGPQQQLPLPFPSHWKRPRKNDFLRDENDLKESYQAALKTSYLGLAVDPPAAQQGDDCPLTATLEELQKRHYFQTDITQPFGLGTKCAKTYVTRCLVGDPGTTYKYLGLRMFAYSWQKKPTENVCRAVGDFKDQTLVPRTRHHLQRLQQQRTYHYNADRSRPCYNICLINRMDSGRDDYKVEPTLDEDHTRIAVAWHADSSLEHYSNIAVYQAILGHDRGKNDWSLAVRTTPNAEGPSIASDIRPDPHVPPLSIRLPSRSTYYMLDDFNHHHQHAVLKTNHNNNHNKTQPKTIRYSATYRLLRPSHTVQELLEQCRNTSRGFHKKGLKPWRSEQVLLTHVEGEWLRQFYVQGSHHKGMLWEDWKEFLTELWKHWGSLEARTRFVVDLLTNAARGKCSTDAPPPTGKVERKRRDKQRKALAQVQDVLARDNNNNSNNNNAQATLYRPMVSLLRERAKLRSQWKKREKDFVFTTLDPKHRPLPWPVRYQTTADAAKEDGIMATSPLPEDLGALADQLEACGKAFETGKATDLPAFVVPPSDKASAKVAPVPQSTATNGDKQATTKSSTTANPSSSNGTQAVGNHQNGSKSGKKKKRKHQSSKQTSLDGGNNKKKKKRY